MRLLDVNRGRAVADLVELAVDTLAADSTDDVVALAVRLPGHPPAS